MPTNKCAHPACECEVQQGQRYCSTYCQQSHQQNSQASSAKCACGHPACRHE